MFRARLQNRGCYKAAIPPRERRECEACGFVASQQECSMRLSTKEYASCGRVNGCVACGMLNVLLPVTCCRINSN